MGPTKLGDLFSEAISCDVYLWSEHPDQGISFLVILEVLLFSPFAPPVGLAHPEAAPVSVSWSTYGL